MVCLKLLLASNPHKWPVGDSGQLASGCEPPICNMPSLFAPPRLYLRAPRPKGLTAQSEVPVPLIEVHTLVGGSVTAV